MAKAEGGSGTLARLRPVTSVWVASQDHPTDRELDFVAEIPHERMERLEALRLGGDLAFIPKFEFRISDEVRTRIHDWHDQVNVAQSEWIKLLARMNYGRMLLYEIPAPDPTAHPMIQEAMKALGEMHQDLLKGRWRNCVACGRDVLEALRVALDSNSSEWGGDKKKAPLADRLRELRQALMFVAHPAKHRDQNAVSIQWERLHAQAIFGALSALIPMFVTPE